ncbi:type VII secretion target [Actinoplanes sp. CA-252034]|uniref:type VII secretion target n=1 Tax=Actinoplanes sp. CA-252034 TaxID=3239906 RepID=UPI003D9574B2
MQFPAEAVRQHATTVGETAEQVALARSAVREVSMDRQAYGEICQFLPGLLDPLFEGAMDVLSMAVDALSETAYELRATAETIEATDADSAGRIIGVQRS